MKKLGYAIAALGTIALALPSIVNAETVVIKKHRYDPYDSRAEFREHRDFGWHHGWRERGERGEGVTIIKRHRHFDND